MAAPIELLTCRSTHASLRRLCPLDLRLVCWLRSWRQPWSCDRYSGTDLPYLPTGTKFYHTFPRPYTSVRPTPRLRSGEPQLQLWPWPTTLTRATDTRLTTTFASAAWPTTSQHCQQHDIYSASRFHAQSNQTGLTVMTPLIKGRAIGIAVRVSPWAWSKPSERHLSLTSTSSEKRKLVLGIETSCDDTGAAVVDQYGTVLGESLISQTKIHVEAGGIIPPVARDLHDQNIEGVVQRALDQANLSLTELDAIAVTVKPGLLLSLYVGAQYAKQLVAKSKLPFIPIHHMEAHALTARMIEDIPFPFLVLLISGGHCLLAVARDVDDFLLLGKSLDDAPGDAFDKTARRLRLKNLLQCSGLSGGAAIEKLALDGDPLAFGNLSVMSQQANCNFSFSGMKDAIKRIIMAQEETYDIGSTGVLPNVADVCASFQYSVMRHLAKRLQRALLFCELKNLLPSNRKTLVVSGGVASNMFLRTGLEKMCAHYDCQVIFPPPKLCTDNGIMIAWNGMEKLKAGIGTVADPESVDIQAKCQLGRDITTDVEKCSIKLKRIKLL